MSITEKFEFILACGSGHKFISDDLFKCVDNVLKVYRREGVFEIESQINESRATELFKCNVNGCVVSFTSLELYDRHYNSSHRYTCSYCRKMLQSSHLLDLHICETHDNFFFVSKTKKAMYKCYNETCSVQFWNSEERDKHCKEIHKFSQTFLHHTNKLNKKKEKNCKKKKMTSTSALESMADLKMVLD
ncbi:zinc finger protein 511 [Daktulosphaira vitifoliae]|uniref:zinc finger protein 511 n=1 Tax=Daktulosphaira vitifoliae TaxID=58002 RepID=UPI0021A991A4|nr:zinc finger protein 511 [Daktulosphaira vitifoliae]